MVHFPRRGGLHIGALLVALVLMIREGVTERTGQWETLIEYESRRRFLSQKEGEPRGELLVVKTNNSDVVKEVCGKYGYRFVRKVFGDENYYLFRKRDTGGRSRRWTSEPLGQHSEIEWACRQSLRTRVRRSLTWQKASDTVRNLLLQFERVKSSPKSPEEPSDWSPKFNDPLFKEQWYLHNVGQTGSPPGNDIDVLPVWRAGLTGKGVAIAVLDDGVHAHSEEVSANYESTLSEEYLFRNSRVEPVPENSHGTRCAAVAAGVANNGVCGVGVAYEARVGGVRLLDGPLTDVQEALALVHALDRIDIYTASWGPTDKGQAVDGPGILARMAFVKGVTQGRHGKGSIYVWAAGNGGGHSDHCSVDGYASSPYTVTIGALTEEGRSAFYSEPCPSLIAAVYVGGRAHTMPHPQEWKIDKTRVKVVVPEGRGRCGAKFQGTSAAAPMAAGVVALALQANPDLSWRDVQHLIIATSVVPDPPESGWLTNAAGFHFHPKVGSGALNARLLVERARNWTAVGPLRIFSTEPDTNSRLLPSERRVSVPILVLESFMVQLRGIDHLETVIVTLTIHHAHRSHLELELRSPKGTTSQLLGRRPLDNSTSGFERWDFVTLHFWGEKPEGVWLLTVFNHHPQVGGSLDYISLTLHGTRNL